MPDHFIFKEIAKSEWPEDGAKNRVHAYISSKYLVQVFDEGGGITRLSINNININSEGDRWIDGITWNELQKIKDSVGFAHKSAIEFYPMQSAIVNVANIRHLWVMDSPLPFMWGAA